MTISREEGLSLLNKWRAESIKVIGVLVSSLVVVGFEGFITLTSDSALIIQQSRKPEAKEMRLVVVNLAQAISFDYGDQREIDLGSLAKDLIGVIESALMVELPDGKLCIIEAAGHREE
jgi:hypothetical protein